MNSLKNSTAYILCGGKSTRMQTEKGLVELQKKPFVAHIIEKVTQVVDSVFLVTKDREYEQFKIPMIADTYEGKGPLGGIHAALSHTNQDQVLILSCDIPLMTVETLKALYNNTSSDYNIVFATTEDHWHPLAGIYSKSLLPNLEAALESNRLKLVDFIKMNNYKPIRIADARSLSNINTPEALAELENSLT